MDDVSKLKQELDYWKRRALTDALTGLPNRDAMYEDISDGDPHWFIFADIDDFKQVNDTQGHDAGDRILQDVARVLETVAEQFSGSAYRLGGEEFVLRLPEPGAVAGRKLHVGEVLTTSVELETDVTISAGGGDTISRADQAMYESKTNGKNQFRLY